MFGFGSNNVEFGDEQSSEFGGVVVFVDGEYFKAGFARSR
jgi:hypothetical protein